MSIIIPERTVIMASNPCKYSLEEMKELAKNIKTERDLAIVFAAADDAFWWFEDEIYDYEEDSQEYINACCIADAWWNFREELEERIFKILRSENIIIPETGRIVVLAPFMQRNGYRNANGWWIKINE